MAKLCEQVDQVTNQCLNWVEHTTLLPELTYTQAFAIGGAFIFVMATVWAINMIKYSIIKT